MGFMYSHNESLNLEKLIFSYCQDDDVEEVKSTLEKHPNIDIFYKDGMFFRLAVSNGSTKMLKLLIDYVEQSIFGKYEFGSVGYLLIKNHLVEVLEEQVDFEDLGNDMHKILEPYERQCSEGIDLKNTNISGLVVQNHIESDSV
jgi:hypothetical protein